MKLAALLCPGPSLAVAKPRADVLVGVNRAPFIRPDLRCDVWCFGDGNPYLRVEADGGLRRFPAIFAAQKALVDIGDAGRMDGLKAFPAVTEWENAFSDWHPSWGWPDYSATAGLIAAARAGATRIHCYGCDWTDAPDADGFALPTNDRTPKRWKNEAVTWRIVCDELAHKGIRVARVPS